MKIRKNRPAEREAVNAARSFFESHNCVFQEVELANDYGKDAYVDIVDEGEITGLCIAVQIKGGASYRRSGGYGIPLDEDHAEVWRQSSVPVAGLVYDPEDRAIRWCNISTSLENVGVELPTYIPVSSSDILSKETLIGGFRASFASYHSQRAIGPALLKLVADDPTEQRAGLLDCFALGRAESRVLIAVRYLLNRFQRDELRLAIRILAHATPHPDILWHKGNWIPEAVCKSVASHLQWTEGEIAHLMNAVTWDEWFRGCPGQDVYSLLCVDHSIEKKMGEVAIRAIQKGDEDLAFGAMYLVIYWARQEGYEMYKGFLAIDRRFGSLPLSKELEMELKECGYVILFE